MKPQEYRSARETLAWTHERLGGVLGVSERTWYRYSSGEQEIPDPIARLVRLLVLLRLTMSQRKFEELVARL